MPLDEITAEANRLLRIIKAQLQTSGEEKAAIPGVYCNLELHDAVGDVEVLVNVCVKRKKA